MYAIRRPNSWWPLVLLMLFGCGFEPLESSDDIVEQGVRSAELAVPGPWNPPPSTRAIAATHYVPVVEPPSVSPLGSCSSTNP